MIKNKKKQTAIEEALASSRFVVKFILLFGFLINLLMLSTPLFSMQVLDRVISTSNLQTLIMMILLGLLALTLLSLLQTARSLAMSKLGTWFENELSEVILLGIFQQSFELRSVANSQSLRDLQTIKAFISGPNLIVVMDMPWALIFISVLFMLHFKIGCLALISVIVLVLFTIVVDRHTKPLMVSNNNNLIDSMRYADQAIKNAEVIQAMGMKKNVINSWQVLNKKVRYTQDLVTKKRVIFTEFAKFFRLIVQISVTSLGAYLVIKGELSTGAIIASSSLVGRALAPFESAVNSSKTFVKCYASYQRLKNVLYVFSKDSKKMKLPNPMGKIDVENLSLALPGMQKYTLRNINFTLDAGEVLAIIGASASGKTTLAKLLVGTQPASIGSIRIDGADLRDYCNGDLGKSIGYLPQEIGLFSGTIEENIARMNTNPNHEDVIEAAQLAGVHNMILGMPGGYNFHVGFDGAVLSGGQKQRIGLARAFYGQPKFIVLDEPNANLDVNGEEALVTAIAIAKERKITMVIISHKSTVLNYVDKIMVLKDGAVQSFGLKKEILEKHGRKR